MSWRRPSPTSNTGSSATANASSTSSTSEGKRQKAKGKNEKEDGRASRLPFSLLPFAFCLLPFVEVADRDDEPTPLGRSDSVPRPALGSGASRRAGRGRSDVVRHGRGARLVRRAEDSVRDE